MSLESHRSSAPKALRFAVLTVSDTRDAATDRGGPFLVDGLAAAGHTTTVRAIVKDDAAEITAAVRAALARDDVDLVLTTGGTGIAAQRSSPPPVSPLTSASSQPSPTRRSPRWRSNGGSAAWRSRRTTCRGPSSDAGARSSSTPVSSSRPLAPSRACVW